MICILIGAALVSLVVATGSGNRLHERIEAANTLMLKERSADGIPQSRSIIQGDIMIPQQTHSNGTLFKRKSAVLRSELWKDGKIPYTLDSKFTDDQREGITKGITMWTDHSCLDIYERKGDEESYINIVPDASCWSWVGFSKDSQPQQLGLSPWGCAIYDDLVAHEFGHALGFNHEQSRPDRDDYVTIQWENMKDGKRHNFEKANEDLTSDYGLPYDMNSLMHYESTYFSKNGQPTIVPKDKTSKVVVGGLYYLSFLDIKAVNIVYQCSDKCPVKLNCLDDGYQKGPAKSGESGGCQCWCKTSDTFNPEELCKRQPSGGGVPTTKKKKVPTATLR